MSILRHNWTFTETLIGITFAASLLGKFSILRGLVTRYNVFIKKKPVEYHFLRLHRAGIVFNIFMDLISVNYLYT